MRISMAHALALFVMGFLVVTAGCSSIKGTTYGGAGSRVHTVTVGPKIEPLQINTGRGDEVRWVNNRAEPIAVIFPKADLYRVSCRSGFKTLDSAQLSAVVPPNSSASLCFSDLGKYDYEVRLNENLPGAQLDRVASVFVVGGGSRNPKPGEQFENMTP